MKPGSYRPQTDGGQRIIGRCLLPAWVAVTLAVTAHDLVDGPVGVLCQTPAGDLYPLGTTEVGCSASDSRGNGSTTTATVTVADTIPPSISVQDLTVEATSAAGAVVEYVATAADAVSGPVPVVCGTASGAVFPLGTTTVHCEATDAAGNTGYASFQVTVADTVHAGEYRRISGRVVGEPVYWAPNGTGRGGNNYAGAGVLVDLDDGGQALLLAESLSVPDFRGVLKHVENGRLTATGKIVDEMNAQQATEAEILEKMM